MLSRAKNRSTDKVMTTTWWLAFFDHPVQYNNHNCTLAVVKKHEQQHVDVVDPGTRISFPFARYRQRAHATPPPPLMMLLLR